VCTGYFANVGDTVNDVPASSSDKSAIYVLESPKFDLKQAASLKFDLFQRSVGPVLSVRAFCALDSTFTPPTFS